jgi:hypothetical protein
MANEQFEGWAIVELMGHRQRAGYVKDVEMFGGKLLRVDIPVTAEANVTEFYGCSAVYALRPCTEEIVRDHVKRSYDGDPRPVRPVDYRIEDKRGPGDDITDENDGVEKDDHL